MNPPPHHPPRRRTTVAALFLMILFLGTICGIPLAMLQPNEPVLVVEPAPTLAPLPGEFRVAAEPALVFPEPPVETGPAMIVHVLQHNESLNDVARQYNVSIEELVAANPGLLEQNIVTGMGINIRPDPAAVVIVVQESETVPVVPLTGQSSYYTVQPGDTLSGIAARFGLSTQALLAANPLISDPDSLSPGQILVIPAQALLPITGADAAPPAPAAASAPAGSYVVRQGDTLYRIATAHGIPLPELIAANPEISDPTLIYPGQTLAIPTAP
jgi:LysM repeat protein